MYTYLREHGSNSLVTLGFKRSAYTLENSVMSFLMPYFSFYFFFYCYCYYYYY